MTDEEVAEKLKIMAWCCRELKFEMDRLIRQSPSGTTREILEVARIKAHDMEGAMGAEAHFLTRFAGLK